MIIELFAGGNLEYARQDKLQAMEQAGAAKRGAGVMLAALRATAEMHSGKVDGLAKNLLDVATNNYQDLEATYDRAVTEYEAADAAYEEFLDKSVA